MAKGYIKNIDWVNAEAMKYWAHPSAYKKDKKIEIKNAVFSGQYWGALKKDGYYQRLVKDEEGDCYMIARSKNVKGEAINKYEWVPQLHDFMNGLPNGVVLLCECYLPSKPGSSNVTGLLGCLKDKCISRQENNGKLHFYIFDVCAWDGENWNTRPALDRFKFLESLSEKYSYEYIEWAKYYNGEELWERLGEALISGEEGMVITREDCPIYFKRTPARMTIKVKKELANTIDCIFTGKATPPTKEYTGKEIETWQYWEHQITGEKKQGNFYKAYMSGEPWVPVTKPYFNEWAGSMEIGLVKGDKVIPIGYLSGLADEIKANVKKYKGAPIEITCMEIQYHEDGRQPGLRHAKFVRFRPDLSITDCNWEKVFN